MSIRAPKNSWASALGGIWTIQLFAIIIAALYVGRDLFVPLALAALITFLLTPVVARLERVIGRITAVLVVVLMLFGVLAAAGWLLTRQAIDLATNLPEYQTNIESKLHSFRMPTGGAFGRFTRSIQHLRTELPGAAPSPAGEKPAGASSPSSFGPATTPIPVTIVDSVSDVPTMLQGAAGTLLSPLGTAALVLLLVIFMLAKREDVRGRLMRLIGQGHISETTRAFDDAGQRVRRYLGMQFLVNTAYGMLIAVGLSFIGVPNAILWGAFAGVMRFIPYVGPWIGAAIPLLLSFAVSKSWLTPIYTLALYGGLELINANALEPWLYGSSTGVSALALIIAALFWTWLWGPIGLLLSTPLTVCFAVLGQHVPRMRFLSVLLSEETPLSPAEEFYHRLLAPGATQAGQLAEAYLKQNSLAALYDSVVLPVITTAETDVLRRGLEPEERASLYEDLIEIVEDFGSRPPIDSKLDVDKVVDASIPSPPIAPTSRVLCLPARAQRDEIAGLMLTQLLRQQHFEVENFSATLSHGELVEATTKAGAEAVCISVVPPSTLGQARYLITKLRASVPEIKIVVGFWGMKESPDNAAQRLREEGVDEIVTTFADAVTQLLKYSASISDEMMIAPRPENEEERQSQLDSLGILDTPNDYTLDRIAKRVTSVFQVPTAFIAFIDRDRQWFKAQFGLPEELAKSGETTRDVSICGHMIAANELLVVEDIARDRRFANNPLLKKHGLRFYAGAPLRKGGQPVGSLCLLDVRPRKFSPEDRRILQLMADEAMEELSQRAEA